MFKCPNCNLCFENYNSLGKHSYKKHNIKGEKLYREYYNIKEIPKCKCGCGEETSWRVVRGYANFIKGHYARGVHNPMYGKKHSEKSKKSISIKRKEKFASGEYIIDKEKYSRASTKMWNEPGAKIRIKQKREAKNWREKISHSMLTNGDKHGTRGKKFPEHSKLMKSPEMVKKIFKNRSDTNIENIMKKLLNELNVEYYHQFFISENGNTYSYDFKIKNKNIIIETDGDYWHGGPGCKKYFKYVNTVIVKDKIKNNIALNNGYQIFRFWGSDIKKNIQDVKNKLIQILN